MHFGFFVCAIGAVLISKKLYISSRYPEIFLLYKLRLNPHDYWLYRDITFTLCVANTIIT